MDELKEEDVKIVSKPEARWTRFGDARKASKDNLEESLIFETELLELAEKKLNDIKSAEKGTV